MTQFSFGVARRIRSAGCGTVALARPSMLPCLGGRAHAPAATPLLLVHPARPAHPTRAGCAFLPRQDGGRPADEA